MYELYKKIVSACENNVESKDNTILSLIKSFVLDVGISVGGIYEQIIRNIIHNDKNFLKFLNHFQSLIELREDHNILKYKCKVTIYFSIASYC